MSQLNYVLEVLAGKYRRGRFPLSKPLMTIGEGKGHDIDLSHGPDQPSHTFGLLSRVGSGYRLQAQSEQTSILHQEDDASGVLKVGDILILPHGVATLKEAPAEQQSDSTVSNGLTSALVDFADKLATSQSAQELIDGLLHGLVELTQAQNGFLMIRRAGHQDIIRSLKLDADTVDPLLKNRSDTIVEHVFKNKEAVLVHSATQDTIFSTADSVLNLRLSSVMCAPLVFGGQTFGVVYLGHNQFAHHFDDQALDILKIHASLGALLLKGALDVESLQSEQRALEAHVKRHGVGDLIGHSEPMQKVFQTIRKVATTSVTVLIRGETGTGKELIAREIHRHSERSRGPLVVLNCGAIPESLLESELFGHVKGAFTGADRARQGQIMAANGGTLFLDEIGEMPLNLQVKLLRVLQERTVTAVGGDAPTDVDIRVIAATHRNLQEMVQKGDFREDLYYRLNVIEIVSPPLRARAGDIEVLSSFMLKQFSEELGVKEKSITSEAKVLMAGYPWPGNVRELQNRLKRAMVLSDGTQITAEDLELDPESCESIESLQSAVERFRKRYVMTALAQHGGNRTQTAKALGVDPRTVFRYLEQEEVEENPS